MTPSQSSQPRGSITPSRKSSGLNERATHWHLSSLLTWLAPSLGLAYPLLQLQVLGDQGPGCVYVYPSSLPLSVGQPYIHPQGPRWPSCDMGGRSQGSEATVRRPPPSKQTAGLSRGSMPVLWRLCPGPKDRPQEHAGSPGKAAGEAPGSGYCFSSQFCSVG